VTSNTAVSIILDIIHAANLSGFTTWNEAIVSTENNKLAKEATYNAHSYITTCC